MMNAFEEYRKAKYGDAVTDAGAAVESVLKTICTVKGWAYDKNKDTCSKLLDICREKGLFHPFYKPILEGTAAIRNKIGDAHGKGPAPEFFATKELAAHMIYTCCANISLLIGLAKLLQFAEKWCRPSRARRECWCGVGDSTQARFPSN
jgi:hypothetical protein